MIICSVVTMKLLKSFILNAVIYKRKHLRRILVNVLIKNTYKKNYRFTLFKSISNTHTAKTSILIKFLHCKKLAIITATIMSKGKKLESRQEELVGKNLKGDDLVEITFNVRFFNYYITLVYLRI